VIDVTPLKIGNKLYVGDIKSEGFTFMHPDNAVVAAVKMSRNAMKGGAGAGDDEEETTEEVPADAVPATETPNAE